MYINSCQITCYNRSLIIIKILIIKIIFYNLYKVLFTAILKRVAFSSWSRFWPKLFIADLNQLSSLTFIFVLAFNQTFQGTEVKLKEFLLKLISEFDKYVNQKNLKICVTNTCFTGCLLYFS